MAVDRTEVGQVAARLMTTLEQRFGEREDASIRRVFLIVVVDHEEEDGLHNEVRWDYSDNIPVYEAKGLLDHVKTHI